MCNQFGYDFNHAVFILMGLSFVLFLCRALLIVLNRTDRKTRNPMRFHRLLPCCAAGRSHCAQTGEQPRSASKPQGTPASCWHSRNDRFAKCY